uniref:Uncharacterized protein n=1 Tax=Kalanchoe fedtschenkoi TaxID=63787 RepID=A0A7N0UCT1_KALFE
MGSKEFHPQGNALQIDPVEAVGIIKEADLVPKVKSKQFAFLIWDHSTKIFKNLDRFSRLKLRIVCIC